MGWTSKRVSSGSDELKAVVSMVLGGYLPGGKPIRKDGKDANQ